MNACVKFINEDMENHPQWHAPCPDIIETLGIKQTTHDLTYYDKEGKKEILPYLIQVLFVKPALV